MGKLAFLGIKDVEIFGVSLRKTAKVIFYLSILGSAAYGFSLVASLIMLPASLALSAGALIFSWVPWKLLFVGGLAYGAYKIFLKERN